METEHYPVMVQEVLQGLNIDPAGLYIDATFGRGGHARAILAELNADGRLLVIDRDPMAVAAGKALAKTDKRVNVRQGTFGALLSTFKTEPELSHKVDGILLDLGVSSPQLDDAERGFSFRLQGPLDMRMDPTTGMSAAEWLNEAEESEISHVLKTYGEEKFHHRMARAIIEARALSPITTTLQLSNIIAKANPAWERHKNPATRAFQAIRIFVNDELNELLTALDASLEILKPGGRLAVISFHSLEDRIVKRFIQKNEKGDDYPRELPILASQLNQKCHRVGKAIHPSLKEVSTNPRARSATLRIAEKIGGSV